ncbi:unnamed protein product, partial [Staurois parvus]
PFGFDSDDESKPVSSKNISQPKSASQQSLDRLGVSVSENSAPLFEENSKTDHAISAETTVSCRFSFDSTLHGLKEKNANKVIEDGKRLHSSPKKTITGNLHSFTEDKNSYFPKKSDNDSKKSTSMLPSGLSTKSCNSSKLPVESIISDFATETDDWGTDSPEQNEENRSSQNLLLYDWDELTQENSYVPNFDSIEDEGCPFEPKAEDDCQLAIEQMDDPEEQTSEDVLQGGVKLGNCRTYCRSNKARSSQGSSSFDRLLDGSSFSMAKSNNATERTSTVNRSSGTKTTGRTRDYTVLHPSCLSVCNVTIQDSMERGIDEFTASPTTDLGEAGRLRKKADLATAKTTTRFRPGNIKSKKDAKLEFFGFDDQDDGCSEEGGSKPLGQSSYRIKYFGFDDLSESDDEEDDNGWHQKERKLKKKAMSADVTLVSDMPSSGVKNIQNIDSSNNIESGDDLYALPEIFKKPASRPGDKSRDGARKIFSGPKRSPTKAVYNARHWNQPESDELPAVPVFKAQSAPAKPLEAPCPKDDGVFKAPAPPPKVIKTVTVPTQPYQDIVTALKCRKEHKELYTVVQHVKHFNDVVEFGENQEFTDDIEYLLSGLKCNQPINTRCLSVISLATKCAMPSFRMHLRAHGMVAMVFKTLDDSQHHPNLALCTAALMYILSRDPLKYGP